MLFRVPNFQYECWVFLFWYIQIECNPMPVKPTAYSQFLLPCHRPRSIKPALPLRIVSEVAVLNAVCIVVVHNCIPFPISDIHSVSSTFYCSNIMYCALLYLSCTTILVRWVHVVAEGSSLTTPALPGGQALKNFSICLFSAHLPG